MNARDVDGTRRKEHEPIAEHSQPLFQERDVEGVRDGGGEGRACEWLAGSGTSAKL